MRPTILHPLFAPLASLPGLGDKTALLLKRLLGAEPRVVDLLFHLPSGFVDRRLRPTVAEAPIGPTVMLQVEIEEHRPPPPRRARAPHRVIASDATGTIAIVFFKAPRGYAERLLPVGARRWVSGRLELYDGMLQMPHPERIVDQAGLARLPEIEPTYPLTEGVTQGLVQRAVKAALGRLPKLAEWIDPDLVNLRDWPGFGDALAALHTPHRPEELAQDSPARARLAYDELLASQLAIGLLRAHMRQRPGRASAGDGRIVAAVEAALPFTLTPSQERATAQIRGDLAEPRRMLRLLQGDVGSGKTVVALLAMATVVEAGRQAALMAPTEILARQHLKTIRPLAEAAGMRVALLTGREKGRERAGLIEGVARGEIDIVVGTHALFQEDVAFHDLALAVVDEQHRFGVHQRLALAAKGEAVDMLVMTATPIPRTLVLTYFGDMDVSALTDKPAGRLPITTRLVSMERHGEVVEAVRRAIGTGARIYWVCPLVAESELLDVAAAEDRARELEAVFPGQVALVHGRLKAAEKDAAMARFASGEAPVLVATTVIEVGVDVPEASVMVIEHAERFGLAQLHQLRGRVGRGEVSSTCLLLYRGPLGPTAQARLRIMRETEDGFRIAEEDLRLRGEGEVLGTRQSGLPGFRLAAEAPHDLLEIARKDAARALHDDAALATARGQALRTLLYLFERDEAVRLIRAG